MKSNSRKDTILNSAVLFATWLVVISAGVSERLEASTAVVPINYQIE